MKNAYCTNDWCKCGPPYTRHKNVLEKFPKSADNYQKAKSDENCTKTNKSHQQKVQ